MSEKINPPTQLILETAAVCNLHCPQCWIGLRWIDREKSLMSMDLFNKVCNEAKDFIKHTYLHLWGEPTLNKNLSEMIKITKQFSTIDLATHGLFVTEENVKDLALCDTISVSIDGVSQEVYEKYRVGGKVQKAMNGLKLLAKEAPGKVMWTYVLFKENEHEVVEAEKIAKALGINFGTKPPVFWDKTKITESMPSDEGMRRYVFKDGDWHLKADRFKCREFWNTFYVLPTGDVITCCYDGNAEYVVGNVLKDSIIDVWNNDKYNEMRNKHSGGVLNQMCEKYCNLPPN
jgi:radical SAM protein with 4Fe4S-binding SPASM domain